MELIKKIKQAEAQARQIIEQAKADAALQAEENRKNRQQALAKAEHHDATKAVVEWCLPLAPTSLRFYRVALRSLRRAAEPDKALVRQIRQTLKAMKGGDDESAEEDGRQAAQGGG